MEEESRKSPFEISIEKKLDSLLYKDGHTFSKEQLRAGIKMFDTQITRIVFAYEDACSFVNCGVAIQNIGDNIFKITDNEVDELRVHSCFYKRIRAFIHKNEELAIKYLEADQIRIPKEECESYLSILSNLAKKCLKFNFRSFEREMFVKSFNSDVEFNIIFMAFLRASIRKRHIPDPDLSKSKRRRFL